MTGQRANNGLAFKTDVTGASAQFDTKENMATSHEPTLEIVLAGPKGDQGEQGVKGEDGEDGDQGPAGPVYTGSTVILDSAAPVEGFSFVGTLPQWNERQYLEINYNSPTVSFASDGLHVIASYNA